MATDEIQQRALSLLEAEDPDLSEVQRVGMEVHTAFMEASEKVSSLKGGREHILIEGADEEAAQYDEKLRAAERARDRWRLLEERLKPVRKKAQEARRAELAESAAAELPGFVKAAEKAEEEFLMAKQRLETVAARVASSDVKLRSELRERIEAIIGKSVKNHGFAPPKRDRPRA